MPQHSIFMFSMAPCYIKTETTVQVSPGSNCMFVQEVAAINAREKHCCTLGEISKRAIVTPDIEHLLDSFDKMEA